MRFFLELSKILCNFAPQEIVLLFRTMQYTLNIKGRLMDLSEPVVMGILNATPDSFFAGSRRQTEQEIAERANEIVAQGGPLSPMLSNIMLNELDKELERRGHKFVRYADDLVIFCKSRKAAQRTYEHIVPFIEGKLFLKVNKEKTKVAYMRDIKFLSYAFGRRNGKCQYRLHPESISKMKDKIRELTSRSNGWSYEYRKQRLQWYIRGWSNYFSLAGYKRGLEEWDSWLRRRIRMCIWKSWKRVRARYHNLQRLVPDENRIRIAAFSRKSYWRMAQHPVVHEAMSDERLRLAGYPTFTEYYVDFNKARGYY